MPRTVQGSHSALGSLPEKKHVSTAMGRLPIDTRIAAWVSRGADVRTAVERAMAYGLDREDAEERVSRVLEIWGASHGNREVMRSTVLAQAQEIVRCSLAGARRSQRRDHGDGSRLLAVAVSALRLVSDVAGITEEKGPDGELELRARVPITPELLGRTLAAMREAQEALGSGQSVTPRHTKARPVLIEVNAEETDE